jgi:hypothetical protein
VISAQLLTSVLSTGHCTGGVPTGRVGVRCQPGAAPESVAASTAHTRTTHVRPGFALSRMCRIPHQTVVLRELTSGRDEGVLQRKEDRGGHLTMTVADEQSPEQRLERASLREDTLWVS